MRPGGFCMPGPSCKIFKHYIDICPPPLLSRYNAVESMCVRNACRGRGGEGDKEPIMAKRSIERFWMWCIPAFLAVSVVTATVALARDAPPPDCPFIDPDDCASGGDGGFGTQTCGGHAPSDSCAYKAKRCPGDELLRCCFKNNSWDCICTTSNPKPDNCQGS
jgi:hypothetical protein